jgi:phosphoenolpyruvate carboxykinase (GTP)
MRISPEQMEKLRALQNPEIIEFVERYADIMEPESVFVCTDSKEDYEHIRKRAINEQEEKELSDYRNHTVHFDNYYDQARDKEHTAILTENGEKIPFINTKDRDEGLEEIYELMKGIMKGREMIVAFFSLGPRESPFSILGIQITDSPYVAHSEHMLYRTAYDEFKRLGEKAEFFRFVHSEGELDERKTSKNLDKRRIYIDLKEGIVYTINTQYGGNTIGLKKPAFRLTIDKAAKEGWLSEHMFLMGVNGPDGRVSYFTGAFPSMCGKTSTCMVRGERLVGDDLSFIRDIEGEPRAVNVENGVFGIIQGINSNDDPAIWKVLHSDNEVIFSNILVNEGMPYWTGMDGEIPDRGENHSGEWWKGKKDAEGNEIPPSHKNARFTVRLSAFDNLDAEALNNPKGVKLSGMIFGGRDADTWPPVCESFGWRHGVIMKGASVESETTAATLGKEGVRKFNAMAILDFMSIHLGKYLDNYLRFGEKLGERAPKIFAVNYFLRDENGEFLNSKLDKAVWLKWMELRANGDADAIETPIGYIPKYEDLKRLFSQVLGKEYSYGDYEKQFTIRVPELLAKIDRIEEVYREMDHIPQELFDELDAERKRLLEARTRHGDYIKPDMLQKK